MYINLYFTKLYLYKPVAVASVTGIWLDIVPVGQIHFRECYVQPYSTLTVAVITQFEILLS